MMLLPVGVSEILLDEWQAVLNLIKPALAASDLGQHRLPKSDCPDTQLGYDKFSDVIRPL